MKKENEYLILGVLLGLATTILYDVVLELLNYPHSPILKITASVVILMISFYWYRRIK